MQSKYKLVAINLLVLGVLLISTRVQALSADDHILYLPLVSMSNSNPVHQGIATYYDATGEGACGFDASPADLMVTAMNADEYDHASYCGAYLHVEGPKGAIIVRVIDLCPECQSGHLDLSREAFAEIADLYLGRVDITGSWSARNWRNLSLTISRMAVTRGGRQCRFVITATRL